MNLWDHFVKQGYDRDEFKRRFYGGLYGSQHLEDQMAYDEVLAVLTTHPEYLRQLMASSGGRH